MGRNGISTDDFNHWPDGKIDILKRMFNSGYSTEIAAHAAFTSEEVTRPLWERWGSPGIKPDLSTLYPSAGCPSHVEGETGGEPHGTTTSGGGYVFYRT